MIAVAAMAALTMNLWGGKGEAQAYDKKLTREALRQAKQALLARIETGGLPAGGAVPADIQALLFKTIGGRLPCSSANGDGSIDTPCGTIASVLTGVHNLGLFPWRGIDIDPLKDAASECLWYAVSGDFKNASVLSNRTQPLNLDTNGAFTVIQPIKNINPTTGAITWSEKIIAGGAVPANQVVAVIMAPGRARGAQTRTTVDNTRRCQLTNFAADGVTPSAQLSAPNYLESYAGSVFSGDNRQIVNLALGFANIGPHTFVQADDNHERLNDELIWITAEEFANAAAKRTVRIMAEAINQYVYGFFESNAFALAPAPAALAYVAGNGYFPTAASVPGGPCVAGRLQGYVPMSCGGGVSATWNAGFGWYLGSRIVNGIAVDAALPPAAVDPDGWLSHAHYAVSENCTAPNGLAINTPPFTATNPPSTICTIGTPRIAVGADITNVQALILMRGRPITGLGQTAAICNAGANGSMHLCLEDPINSAKVLAGNTLAGPPFPGAVPALPPYQLIQTGSNDILHLFKQRTFPP